MAETWVIACRREGELAIIGTYGSEHAAQAQAVRIDADEVSVLPVTGISQWHTRPAVGGHGPPRGIGAYADQA